MDRPLSGGTAALTLLVLLPTVAQAIVVLHESSHALAALAFGATIRKFQANIFAGKPHVAYSGLAEGERAVVTAAGPALPLLAWLAWLLAVRREPSPWHRQLLFVAAVGTLFPLLLWSSLPLLGRQTRDDSILFVSLTGASPYVVSAGALVLLLACGWILTRRINVLATIRDPLPPLVSPRFHAVLCSALLLVLILLLALSR